MAELQEWLEQDEAGSRAHRAKRLATMLAVLPDEGMVFFGGMSSAQTYIELDLPTFTACISRSCCLRLPVSSMI